MIAFLSRFLVDQFFINSLYSWFYENAIIFFNCLTFFIFFFVLKFSQPDIYGLFIVISTFNLIMQ